MSRRAGKRERRSLPRRDEPGGGERGFGGRIRGLPRAPGDRSRGVEAIVSELSVDGPRLLLPERPDRPVHGKRVLLPVGSDPTFPRGLQKIEEPDVMHPKEGPAAELVRRHDISERDLPHAGEDDLGALRLLVAWHELASDELSAAVLEAVVRAVNRNHGGDFTLLPGICGSCISFTTMRDKVSIQGVLWPILLAAAVVSCGGSDAPPSEAPPAESAAAEAPPPDAVPCAVLNAQEIQEVLGKAPGTPQAPAGTEDCLWPDASDPATNLLRITVSDSGYASYDTFVASYQAEFGGEQPPTEYFRPVEGIGDWAMYVADEHALQVFRGGRMLQVSMDPYDDAKALALAQKAIGRLP